jgi:hypothetical protein
MARSTTSTDALIEILNFCEQALTALDHQTPGKEQDIRSNKTHQNPDIKRPIAGVRLQLIQGGRSSRD